jgi:general secretion pathway protein E
MVGEIRDSETASIAIQASLTGHLVLSTIHTNSAIGAIARLRDMGVESYLLASSIKIVLAQRLVRRLCNHCKKPSSENVNLLKKFNLCSESIYYEPSGCQHCSFTGYSGRLAIAELVEIDENLKQMIHDEASEKVMNDYAFQNNQSIQESIKLNLENGITSISEIVRLQNISDA